MLFVSVRRLCFINGSTIGIGNVIQSMHHNILDAIGKPSVKNHTLQNRSSIYLQGTKVIIVKDCCSLPS